jgi:hypothetical protein
MPKSFFNPAEYSLVADRITEFYDRFPTGRIITELVSRERDIVFRAEVYRRVEDSVASATGWASEREGDGEINLVACLENSETSAIGRALANLGFTASRKRPSYEEMQKAERARMRFPYSTTSTRTESAASPTSPRVAESRRATLNPEAEKDRNLTADVVLLLNEAENIRVPFHVLEPIRKSLGHGFVTTEDLTRMERQLRHWILKGVSRPGKPAADSTDPAPGVNTSHQ